MTPLDPLDLLASLTDDVGRWWTYATEVQRADARAILDPGPDDPRRHWLGRAKGYSKTRDVAAFSIVVLLTQMAPAEQGFAAASDADQAGLVRQSIAAFRAHTPALERRITVESRRVVAEGAQSELVILAADSAGSHGLRPKWLAVDELANFPDTERHRTFFDSLWAGLPKVAGSRGVIMTTAGSPGHFARRIFELANDDPLWRLSDVHGPPPWTDPAEVEAERRRLFPSQFARLWLNEWANSDDAIADPDDVEAACVLDGPLAPEPETRYIVTLDIGTRIDNTAAVIAHAVRDPEGTRVVVDRLHVWKPKPGTPVSIDDVRAWVAEMSRVYNHALVRYDPSQGYLLAEQLRKGGVPAEEFVFSTASVGRLATALGQALRGRLLTLPNDDELREEILNVRMRETAPNVLRIDHKSGGHDDRVIACSMATYLLTATAPGSGGPVIYDDAEFAELMAANARANGEPNLAPVGEAGVVPLPAKPGHPYSGDWSLNAAGLELDESYDDEDGREQDLRGQTQRSPWAQ